MPAVFRYRHTVRKDEIDEWGHANNVAYVGWLQSAAVAHSAAQGWPEERYRKLGTGWVVRSHRIEYLQPALVRDEVYVETWVATMKKASSVRRYRVFRTGDHALLARAETRWACVSFGTGQAVRIPAEIAEAFQLDDREIENDDRRQIDGNSNPLRRGR